MQRMGILFNSMPFRNDGPLAEAVHLKNCVLQGRSALENNESSHNFVKNITFGISSDRHVDVKASLTKSET